MKPRIAKGAGEGSMGLWGGTPCTPHAIPSRKQQPIRADSSRAEQVLIIVLATSGGSGTIVHPSLFAKAIPRTQCACLRQTLSTAPLHHDVPARTQHRMQTQMPSNWHSVSVPELAQQDTCRKMMLPDDEKAGWCLLCMTDKLQGACTSDGTCLALKRGLWQPELV